MSTYPGWDRLMGYRGMAAGATVPRPTPAWLIHPYAGRNACYGCGLTPEVMNPGQWVLCRYCNDLRRLLNVIR